MIPYSLKGVLFQCAFLFTFLFFTAVLKAEQVRQLQPLSFGEIAVKSDTGMVQITVSSSGEVSHSDNVILLKKPQPAKFIALGYPPHKRLYLKLYFIDGERGNSDFVQFPELNLPEYIVTDNQGKAVFYLGGEVHTPLSSVGDIDLQQQFVVTAQYSKFLTSPNDD